MTTHDIRLAVADMDRGERIAFTAGLALAFGIANEVLTEAMESGGDVFTLADARLRLIARWQDSTGAFIDELTGAVHDA